MVSPPAPGQRGTRGVPRGARAVPGSEPRTPIGHVVARTTQSSHVGCAGLCLMLSLPKQERRRMRTRIALGCVSSIFLLAAAACSSSSESSGPEDASGDAEQADGTSAGTTEVRPGLPGRPGRPEAAAAPRALLPRRRPGGGADADATVSESQDATIDATDAKGSESEAGPDGGDAAGGGNPYYDGSPGACGAWTSISASASQARRRRYAHAERDRGRRDTRQPRLHVDAGDAPTAARSARWAHPRTRPPARRTS